MAQFFASFKWCIDGAIQESAPSTMHAEYMNNIALCGIWMRMANFYCPSNITGTCRNVVTFAAEWPSLRARYSRRKFLGQPVEHWNFLEFPAPLCSTKQLNKINESILG